MYTGLLHTHSGLRWILLILLIMATVNAFLKWRSGKTFQPQDRKITAFAMIFAHVNLLIAIALYFVSPKVTALSEAMGDRLYRFFSLEHPLMMIIAIVLITMGYSKGKRIQEDTKKFKTIFWYYFIALVIILFMIPWPWQGYGSGWG